MHSNEINIVIIISKLIYYYVINFNLGLHFLHANQASFLDMW